MKKFITIVIVTIIMLTASASSFGNNIAILKPVKVYDVMKKETTSYDGVAVILNGYSVDANVPGLVISKSGQEAIYVPLSVIYRKLGAKVSWSSSRNELTIKYKGDEFLYKVDSSKVIVNGETKDIRDGFATKLLKRNGIERAMVPTSVFTDFMNMEVSWDPEKGAVNIDKIKQEISTVVAVKNGPYVEFKIRANEELSYFDYVLDGSTYSGSNKIVFEFLNSVILFDEGSIVSENDGLVTSAVVYDPGKRTPRVRLDITTKYPSNYIVTFDEEKIEYTIRVINQITSAKYKKDEENGFVEINTKQSPNYKKRYTANSIILEIEDTEYAINNKYASRDATMVYEPVGEDGIVGINTAQKKYDSGKVSSQVEIIFERSINPQWVFVNKIGNDLFVHHKGDPMKGLGYERKSSSTSVLTVRRDYGNEEVISELTQNGTTLLVKIPKSIADLESIEHRYNDTLIESLSVEGSASSDYFTVSAKLKPGTKIYNNSSDSMISFAFINENIKYSENQSKLIVIDAGHGGKDPGAKGKYIGTYEKTLNLQLSLLLRDKLEAEGYRVYMIRDTDVYISLYTRSGIANDLGADAFISVHHNASDSLSRSGIETLYCPDEDVNKYGFSKDILEGLVNATGANSGGAMKRPDLVITRETEMPSIVAELGYLTNKTEEIKINDVNYMEKEVDGIVRGLNKYFK